MKTSFNLISLNEILVMTMMNEKLKRKKNFWCYHSLQKYLYTPRIINTVHLIIMSSKGITKKKVKSLKNLDSTKKLAEKSNNKHYRNNRNNRNNKNKKMKTTTKPNHHYHHHLLPPLPQLQQLIQMQN